MSKSAVSVIIPTHNRSHFLREALDSVAAQTFQDMEVIVVDDGSTEDVAKAISGHRTRPRLLSQRQQGPAAARNRGIAAATSELIAFLDSDDTWKPTKLERFVEAMRSQPRNQIFYGPMIPTDPAGRPVRGRTKPCSSGWITNDLFQSSFVHVPTVLCRRSLLEEAGGFDTSLPVCEDYDLWLRISAQHEFGLIEEPLAFRRLHSDRLSKREMSRNLIVKAQVLERFYNKHVGSGRLDIAPAIARLGRVCFVAGREAFREKKYAEAVELCRSSRRYGQSVLRVLPFLLTSQILQSRSARPAQLTSGPISKAAPLPKNI